MALTAKDRVFDAIVRAYHAADPYVPKEGDPLMVLVPFDDTMRWAKEHRPDLLCRYEAAQLNEERAAEAGKGEM